ncbi:AsnC family transcriptional regulator [Paractinoplanes deccanensis]|uniref:AsnC family transcriptional regulator n=1 Tax=Paractinoplanes deccanensis TaxID=113561 RepID=A0ABQ3XZ76_9ACTN|nr:Lrp/AsnC family transcriptional regulator [Actinoplanes deccanensis]GID73037.1 AsnC family transcriptional regulator [Actinoplanes deccanensis]
MPSDNPYQLDPLDARILLALDADPDAGVLALARTLGISRNTIGARMRRMAEARALTAPTTRVRPEALDHPLIAFVAMTLRQPARARAFEALRDIPNVLEIHATTGDFDIIVRIAARDTDDLYDVTNRLLEIDGVERTNTMISMRCETAYRTRPLIRRLARAFAEPARRTGQRAIARS